MQINPDNLALIESINEMLDCIVAKGGTLSYEDKLELDGYVEELETD